MLKLLYRYKMGHKNNLYYMYTSAAFFSLSLFHEESITPFLLKSLCRLIIFTQEFHSLVYVKNNSNTMAVSDLQGGKRPRTTTRGGNRKYLRLLFAAPKSTDALLKKIHSRHKSR